MLRLHGMFIVDSIRNPALTRESPTAETGLLWLLTSILLLTGILIIASNQTVQAQQPVSLQCAQPGTSSLSAPVGTLSTTTAAPAILNVPQQPVTNTVIIPLRTRGFRFGVRRSTSPAIVQSVAPTTVLTAPSAPILTQSLPNLTLSGSGVSAQSTQTLRLRINSNVGGSNSIQSSGNCRCDVTALRSLAVELEAFSRRLDEYERTNGLPSTRRPSDDAGDLLDGLNGDE